MLGIDPMLATIGASDARDVFRSLADGQEGLPAPEFYLHAGGSGCVALTAKRFARFLSSHLYGSDRKVSVIVHGEETTDMKINFLHIVMALAASGCLLLASRELMGRSLMLRQFLAAPVLATVAAVVLLLFMFREPWPRAIWGAALILGLAAGAFHGARTMLKVDQVRDRFRLPTGRPLLPIALALVLAVGLAIAFALLRMTGLAYAAGPAALAALCAGLLLGHAAAIMVRIPRMPHDGR